MTRTAQALTDAKREGWSKWIRSEADEAAVRDGCWFDEAAGRRRIALIEQHFKLTMAPWTGQPFKLMDWQRDDIVMPLYSWKKDRSRPHLRRYSKGDVFVAKKNGKSTLCGALGVAELLLGGNRAEIYGAAHVREQAAIIYREAVSIVQENPELAERLRPIEQRQRIINDATGSFYRVLAGETHAGGVEGINPTLVLFDEVHVQKNRKFYDGLVYAGAARPNSLLLSVSTVGVVDEHAIWWELWEYAQNILAGRITDHARFAYIASADPECKTDSKLRSDPKQWLKANPGLGHTVQEDKFAEDLREAENEPRKLNSMLRYRFNIPVGQDNPALDVEKFRSLSSKFIPSLDGRTCYGGLDMASTEDLTAFALYFPPAVEQPGVLMSWFWAPEERMRSREKKGLATYITWERDGWIHRIPGARIEHEPIAEKIIEIAGTYNLQELGFDRWNSQAVVNMLDANGIRCIEVPQTMSGMSDGCVSFSNEIAKGSFVHDGNPVMVWCVGNCIADSRSTEDTLRFDKNKSKDKIDGAVAAAMAFGRAKANEGLDAGGGEIAIEFSGSDSWEGDAW